MTGSDGQTVQPAGLRALVAPRAALFSGRLLLGTAVLASGAMQLVTGEFVRLVPKLPGWFPAPLVWPYVVGVILVVLGAALIGDRMVRTASNVLALIFIVDLLFLHLPSLISFPGLDHLFLHGFMWTNPLKCVGLVGGAALLAARLPEAPSALSLPGPGIGALEPIAPFFFSIFLIVCGLEHFSYATFVTNLVPAWMPARTFWTYFTGTALCAGGTGILVPRSARLAADLSALMIFLWVLMLHIPRALTLPEHAFEAAGIFEALAMTGVALIISGTRGPRTHEDRAR